MLLQELLSDQLHFSEAERSIADYVLKRGTDLRYDSARNIAGRIYVSPSSVVRFTQKLGFEGYGEFRDAWMDEQLYISRTIQSVDPNRPFDENDSQLTAAGKLNLLYTETVSDTFHLIDPDMLERAVKYCCEAETIYICSLGAQTGTSEAFREKMAKIGKLVVTEDRQDMLFFHAGNCSPKDCFIFISYTGETSQQFKVVKKAKERNVRCIALTSFGTNTLSSTIDCVLRVSSREHLINNAGTFSIYISSMYLLDVLYAGVFMKNYDKNLKLKKEASGEYETSRSSDNPLLFEKRSA